MLAIHIICVYIHSKLVIKILNMRKFGFLMTFMFVCSVLMAQLETEEKKLMQIVGGDICWGLSYADDGLMTGIVDNSENGSELLWSYDYHISIDGLPYISQNGYFQPGNEFYYAEGEPTFIRESKLNSDGLISNDYNRNTFMWSTGEDFEYEYNDGRMVKMTGDRGIVIELSWTEGNLTYIVFLEDDKEEGRISCSYTNIPAKGICQAFNSPLMFLLHYYTILSLGPLAHGYYGLLSQNLLSEMTISFSEKFIKEHYTADELSTTGYPISNKMSRKYGYESELDGNIISITVSEENNEKVYSLKYEKGITSVNSIPFFLDNNDYYDLQGHRLNAMPQKGVYIQNGKKFVAH